MINLKYYRELAGLSQFQLAKKMGMAQQTISAYENGVRQADNDSLIEFSNFFNITIDDLIKNKTNEKVDYEKQQINLYGLSKDDIKQLNILADYLRDKNK